MKNMVERILPCIVLVVLVVSGCGGGGSGGPPANSVCGNDVVNTGEQCDDGNTVSGDGCSSGCNLEAESSVVVGESGGQYEFSLDQTGNNNVVLKIPTNTFATNTIVSVKKADAIPDIPETSTSVSEFVDIDSSSEQLSATVTVVMKYVDAGIQSGEEEEDVVVNYFDEEKQNWEPVPIQSIDTSSNQVEFITDHFSIWSLFFNDIKLMDYNNQKIGIWLMRNLSYETNTGVLDEIVSFLKSNGVDIIYLNMGAISCVDGSIASTYDDLNSVSVNNAIDFYISNGLDVYAWLNSGGEEQNIQYMTNSAAVSQTAAEASAKFSHFSGVHLDIEPLPENYISQFVDLLMEFNQSGLGPGKSKKLSIASPRYYIFNVGGGWDWKKEQFQQVEPYLDQIVTMSYDYSLLSFVGYQNLLYSTAKVLGDHLSNPGKLNIGISSGNTKGSHTFVETVGRAVRGIKRLPNNNSLQGVSIFDGDNSVCGPSPGEWADLMDLFGQAPGGTSRPIAVISGQVGSAEVGDTVSLDAMGETNPSCDFDGDEITGYEWKVLFNSTTDVTTVLLGSNNRSQSIAAKFTEAGKYDFYLAVTAGGETSVDTSIGDGSPSLSKRTIYVEGAEPENLPPTAVVLSSPTGATTTSLNLSWTQNSDGDFASYMVHHSVTSGAQSPIVGTITSRTTNTYTVTGLSSNTTYYFKIYVCDTGGLCTGSNEVSGTTKRVIVNIGVGRR